jgi:hypothetical protein
MKRSRAGPSSPPIQTVTVSKMEENGEKSPWLPSKVFLRRVVHYVMESVNYDWYETGVPFDVHGQLRNEQKKNRTSRGVRAPQRTYM